MNSFVKQILATVCGIFAFFFISGMLIFGMVGFFGFIASFGSGHEDHSVLRIEMTGMLDERAPASDMFSELMGNDNVGTLGLDELVAAIRAAKDDEHIDGIYLDGGTLSGDYASLQYLRGVLADFKKSGKFIYAYADQYTQGAYYVASVANTVSINPQGMLDWHGIASQPIFYTGLLDKVGVTMQVFKVGTYKSAVEPYILTQMSDANREQVNSYISDIWASVTKEVGASRKVSVQELNKLADGYIALASPKDYKTNKLVDKLAYIDEVRADLRKLTGRDKLSLITPAEVVEGAAVSDGKDMIAVYYASGDIVDEAASTAFNQANEIVGNKVVEDLDLLANDDAVKAVVLRINSGGGSAYASEQMWRAIQQLKAKKPVVVSMSGMAASGGYYMSCGANYIFAEPTTLTGSIGIFGMIPDASGLLKEKLGLSFDVVKTNESSDFGAMGRPFNANEGAAMQGYVDRGYQLFIKRVADGRTAAGHKMTTSDVDKIGQGRVWTGNQALKLGLVDKLGTLDDAIAKAAKLSKTDEYYTEAYPIVVDWMTSFAEESNGDGYLEQRVKTALGDYYAPLSFILNADRNSMLQARIFYLPNLK